MVRRLKLVAAPTDTTPAALKVAFASSDMRRVDQHFGSAESFVIYTVQAEAHHLQEAVQFTGPALHDGNEGKLVYRLTAVEGCDAIYAEAMGPSAKAQLAARNVQGLCVPSATPIAEVLASLQQSLRGESGGGMAVALLRRRDADRFADMEEEGWSE